LSRRNSVSCRFIGFPHACLAKKTKKCRAIPATKLGHVFNVRPADTDKIASRSAEALVSHTRFNHAFMFTGLIEEVGTLLWIRATEDGTQLQIAAPHIATAIRTGESVAVNGCCLTVSAHRDEQLTFDLLDETLDRTNLKTLRRDNRVNLERPLTADGRLDGHFVQGHVDCAAQILSFNETGADYRLEVELPAKFSHYLAHKGSVALNGISLTVAEVLPESFATWIIPHTKRHTNLDTAEKGDWINIEFDVLAKYLERLLERHSPQKDR
jgi:riboflavin synthase